jgi:hypothetical protein
VGPGRDSKKTLPNLNQKFEIHANALIIKTFDEFCTPYSQILMKLEISTGADSKRTEPEAEVVQGSQKA